MSIIKWKPFGELEDFFKDISFNDFYRESSDLAIDISEDKKNVIVEMQVPGINPDKIDIQVEDNHLHISGSRQDASETEDRTYYHKEIKRGSFERVVALPCAVKAGEARADFKEGTLTIVLPKSEGAQSQKIAINK